MSPALSPTYKYKVGGCLERNAPSYVVRQADQDFYEALKAREFCYVLNSRQMGKSSLRVQTMRRLQADGNACGVIDITSIGSHDIDPEEWYLGIVHRLAQSFRTKVKALPWWQEREKLSPLQRLSEFIEEVLLTEISQNIVIFIDEIDSILKLDFKDDFFALLRACYERRADNAEYQHLSFALLGVATPSDLIQDKNRTPFNIGTAIDLQGFQLPEVQPLAQGLDGKVDNPQEVLREILVWTGGQPFLTQKLCQLVIASPFPIAAGSEVELVDRIVRSRIIENWESQDEPEHLKTIRNRIGKNERSTSRLLGLYQQILQQGEIEADDSYEQIDLRLSGLVVEQQGKLRVYNRIYESVFNPSWVEKELAKLRPYAEAFTAWIASNCLEESYLLRGQALQDALAWSDDKSISDRDHHFLTASQELDKRDVQIALEAERQAKQILAEAQQKAELTLESERQANQRLAKAQQRTKQQMSIGAVILVLSLVGATGALVMASRATQQKEKAISEKKEAISARDSAKSQQRQAEQRKEEAVDKKRVAEQKANEAKQEKLQAEQQVHEASLHLTNTSKKLEEVSREDKQKSEDLKKKNWNLKLAEEQLTKADKQARSADQKLAYTNLKLQQLTEEQKKAEAGLKQANEDYDALLEAARDDPRVAMRTGSPGLFTSGVTVASRSSNRLDMFARGKDNALWYKYWNGSHWSDWKSLGGELTSDPSAVASGFNRIDIFARGKDGVPQHFYGDGSNWSSWESLNDGYLVSAPTVVSWTPNQLHVFVIGTDGRAWLAYWNGSNWSRDWNRNNGYIWHSLGGYLTSAPSAIVWNPNQIDVFARLDQTLWRMYWNGSNGSNWKQLDKELISQSSAIFLSGNRSEIFVQRKDNSLWQRCWDGNQWCSDWQSLGREIVAFSAVSWGSNRIDIFARFTDKAIWHKYWDGSSWSEWESLGDTP